LVFLTIIFSDGGNSLIKSIAIYIFVFFLAFVFLGDYLNLLIIRFDADASNFGQFDRNLEIQEFFSSVSDIHLFTGFGANNYLKMRYIGVLDNGVNSLHIGFYNLIYKGGLLYLLFFLYLSYHILSLKKFIRFDPEIKIGYIIGILYLISFSYESGWSYVPIHFFYLLPIYRAIFLKDEIENSFKNNNV
jgi:hypothetical protein